MSKKASLLFFYFCLFSCVFFLGWTFYLLREIDARTDDDVNDDAGVVVVVLRAHNAKTKGFPRREITYHTLSKKKKKRILRALFSRGVFSLL